MLAVVSMSYEEEAVSAGKVSFFVKLKYSLNKTFMRVSTTHKKNNCKNILLKQNILFWIDISFHYRVVFFPCTSSEVIAEH